MMLIIFEFHKYINYVEEYEEVILNDIVISYLIETKSKMMQQKD
jgi:hypothetical protein